MRISPRFMGFMYFIIGILFVYLAVQSSSRGSLGIWRPSVILFMIMATLDFGVALRILFLRQPSKKG